MRIKFHGAALPTKRGVYIEDDRENTGMGQLSNNSVLSERPDRLVASSSTASVGHAGKHLRGT